MVYCERARPLSVSCTTDHFFKQILVNSYSYLGFQIIDVIRDLAVITVQLVNWQKVFTSRNI